MEIMAERLWQWHCSAAYSVMTQTADVELDSYKPPWAHRGSNYIVSGWQVKGAV